MKHPHKILWAAVLSVALFTGYAQAEALVEKPYLTAQVEPQPKVSDPEAAIKAPEPKPFSANSFSFGSFASLRVHEFDGRTEAFGGGLFAQWFPVDHIAAEANVLSEGIDTSHIEQAFTDAGLNLKGYLPIGDSGFAPYGFIGYTRDLEHDEDRANFGAGVEFRTRKYFFAFADGQWTHNFNTLGHALFRLGGGVCF